MRIRFSIPLFGQVQHHSSVLTNDCAGAARRRCPGRPQGRRETSLPWMGLSTAACSRLFEKGLRIVVLLFAALPLNSSPAIAEGHPAQAAASSRTSDPLANCVDEASRRFSVPTRWIRAVIDAESAGDVRAKSPKGAMGLMQIMPETWAELRARYGLGTDPYDPSDNILAGTAYLRELHDRYGSPGFLAAYNAGPGRYEAHLAGRQLPVETEAYLQKLLPAIGSDNAAVGTFTRPQPPAGVLFIERSENSKSAIWRRLEYPRNQALAAGSGHGSSALVPQATGLFVSRSDAGGLR
nr:MULTISPECIES: lytic transglycosylase domain-containing protein [Bradyrhizobium]